MPPRLCSPLPWPFAAAVALFATWTTAGAAESGKLAFNRDIRPILSDACFQCHGPDEAKRKGGLRLDERASATRPSESGEIAIVPGQPEQSALLARLLSKDPDEVMPPAKIHKTLSPEQVEKLRTWIVQGADYQGHWSFTKLERPAVPPVAPATGHPIDAFIRARLAKEGLNPSPEADRPTLLRRAALDLTGLPPTPQEVDAFVADPAPNAYEKVLDRLLASPRFGERMAVPWLDAARYADSNGFQSDGSRNMWAWREWVIQAYNRNLPFDQFTIEQIAGDLLPGATRDQIIASGFNRNTRLNGEGGRIVEEWFAETVIDRVETTGQTWLALSVGCARCHDHKYDPISQKEFYQMFAFFNSCDETGVLGAEGKNGSNTDPLLPLPTAEQEARIATLEAAVKAAQQQLADAQKQLPKLQGEWEKTFREQLQQQTEPWQPLNTPAVQSEGGATFARQEDGSWLAGGPNPPQDTYVITAPLAAGTFSGLLLETLPDPSLPQQSLGRNGNGNFVLTGVEAEITAPSLPTQLVVGFTKAAADYEQKGWEIAALVPGAPAKGQRRSQGWAIDGNDPKKRLPRKAMFLASAPITVPADATLIVRLKHGALAHHNIGRFRLSATSLPPSVVKLDGQAVPPPVREALEIDPARRTAPQRTLLAKFHRENSDNPVTQADARLAAARMQLEDFRKTIPSTMVMKELPNPRDAFILLRGEYDKVGPKVERGLPAALPPLPKGAPMNRLGFAQWLVAPENPLTARVWVNRAWEQFFGTGLSKTTENLGSQAEWPSHPELLDWLATEFIRLRWDMKAMLKTIAMSETYRQSSRVRPEHLAKDPENRLLSRGPRFRLPAEFVRDQALAASGLLVEKIGGPSVRPYMPAGVWDETSKYGNLRNYQPDQGDALYRRTLYTIWKRTAAPPSMLLFDSPSREICTVKRSRTNTPLQALSLLNEVTYVEAARVLAQRMIVEGGTTPEQRIAWGFKRVTCRDPHAEETAILAAGLQQRLAKYRAQADAAAQLASVGVAPRAAALQPGELAAYTLTANVLLNLDEVVTRE